MKGKVVKNLRERLARLRLAARTGFTLWRISKDMTPEQTAATNDIVDGVQLVLKGVVALTKTSNDNQWLDKMQPLIDAAQSFLLKESGN